MIATSVICLEAPLHWIVFALPGSLCLDVRYCYFYSVLIVMFLASKGWLPLLARGTRYWPLIGHSSEIRASDWSDVSMYSDACQTWRLLSVMYRPLRRHTYHSVTNNTNNTRLSLVKYCTHSLPIGQNLHISQGGQAKSQQAFSTRSGSFWFLSFFLISLFILLYLEVRFHCWAGQRRICWRCSPRGRGTSWGEREERERERGRCRG